VAHRDVNYQPALFYAAKYNAVKLVDFFIRSCGMSANMKDKQGRRAIFYAKQENDAKVVGKTGKQGSHAEVIRYLEDATSAKNTGIKFATCSSAKNPGIKDEKAKVGKIQRMPRSKMFKMCGRQ